MGCKRRSLFLETRGEFGEYVIEERIASQRSVLCLLQGALHCLIGRGLGVSLVVFAPQAANLTTGSRSLAAASSSVGT